MNDSGSGYRQAKIMECARQNLVALTGKKGINSPGKETVKLVGGAGTDNKKMPLKVVLV
jgi:hypothetical protein